MINPLTNIFPNADHSFRIWLPRTSYSSRVTATKSLIKFFDFMLKRKILFIPYRIRGRGGVGGPPLPGLFEKGQPLFFLY